MHRKELLRKLEIKMQELKEEEEKHLNKVQKACRFVVSSATSSVKMLGYGMGVYIVQLWANA